ncbi:15648_t:CDS:2, partial [Funneliformis geosporum]
ICELYNEWMSEEVKVAWDSINIEKIKKSFKCCGISVAKDGTEDDFIFDYDFLNDKNDNPGDNVVFEDTIYDDFVAVFRVNDVHFRCPKHFEIVSHYVLKCLTLSPN